MKRRREEKVDTWGPKDVEERRAAGRKEHQESRNGGAHAVVVIAGRIGVERKDVERANGDDIRRAGGSSDRAYDARSRVARGEQKRGDRGWTSARSGRLC